jgi:hypothetical protein
MSEVLPYLIQSILPVNVPSGHRPTNSSITKFPSTFVNVLGNLVITRFLYFFYILQSLLNESIFNSWTLTCFYPVRSASSFRRITYVPRIYRVRTCPSLFNFLWHLCELCTRWCMTSSFNINPIAEGWVRCSCSMPRTPPAHTHYPSSL